VVLVAVILSRSPLRAQPPAESEAESTEETVSAPKAISAAAIEQFREQIASSTDLEEEPKTRIRLTQTNETLQAAIDKIAAKVADIQASLSAPSPELLSDIEPEASLQELTAALATRQPDLQEAKTKLVALEAEPKRRSELRDTIARDMSAMASEKEAIEKELASPATSEEIPQMYSARRVLLQAKLRRLAAAGPAWQAELSRLDAEKAADLTSLRIQLAKKEAAFQQQEVDELQKRINSKRSQDARYIADQLLLFAGGAPVETPYDFPGSDLYSESLTAKPDLATAAETAGQIPTQQFHQDARFIGFAFFFQLLPHSLKKERHSIDGCRPESLAIVDNGFPTLRQRQLFTTRDPGIQIARPAEDMAER
jgi:hypothetical protein